MSVDTIRENCERLCDAIARDPVSYGPAARSTILALRDELDAAEEWKRQMVQKAADKSLDGYRELGARCAAAEERAERAEAERDAARVDAERYRYIRSKSATVEALFACRPLSGLVGLESMKMGRELDLAVDNAIAASVAK